jgi:hypothetical protein
VAARIDEEVAGQTFASRWLDTVRVHGGLVALRSKQGDHWDELTYEEVAVRVARAATGLRALGVGPGDRVVLMMRNIPEFHIVDLAIVFCGATAVSIYNSSPPDQVAYLAGHCHAKVAVVEDAGFLERFTVVRDQLPQLTSIVALAGADVVAGTPGSEGVVTGAVLTDGDPTNLAEAAGLVTPDMLATLIYTSGTTGPPKAVMLTHATSCGPPRAASTCCASGPSGSGPCRTCRWPTSPSACPATTWPASAGTRCLPAPTRHCWPRTCARSTRRPAGCPGVRRRRPAAVRLRAAGARPRGDARLGEAARRRGRVAGRAGGEPRGRCRHRAGRRGRDGRLQPGRAGQEGRSSPTTGCPTGEELTPTSKLLRRGVHDKYADRIEAMEDRGSAGA